MVTTPTHGQANWDVPLNAALNDLQAQITALGVDSTWHPADQGFISWSVDPASASNATALATGVMTVVRMAIRAQTSVTVTSLEIGVNVAGSGLTAGQNLAALYNSAGTRIGVTADQSGTWNSIGHKSMNLTAPVLVTPGLYWVGILSVGTTPPQILRATTAAAGSNNAGLTAANTRFGTIGAALTSPPASFTPATITPALMGWFAGLR